MNWENKWYEWKNRLRIGLNVSKEDNTCPNLNFFPSNYQTDFDSEKYTVLTPDLYLNRTKILQEENSIKMNVRVRYAQNAILI